jgi:hypothetical protein
VHAIAQGVDSHIDICGCVQRYSQTGSGLHSNFVKQRYLPGGRKNVSNPITALVFPSVPLPSDSPFKKLEVNDNKFSVGGKVNRWAFFD